MTNTINTIVEKRVEWLKARAERAMNLSDPIWINGNTAMVGTANEGEAHYYKVSIKHGSESCGCKDWKFRGSKNGIPCKHVIKAMADRIDRNEAKVDRIKQNELNENIAEADQAIKDGLLPC